MIIKTLSGYIKAVNSFRKRIEPSKTILYRGQAKSKWPIVSSLERSGLSDMTFREYYSLIDFFKPEINSYGRRFERKYKFPNGYEFNFSDFNSVSFDQFPEMNYIAYLRHHGFPSPLVDFSKSEYIALFFACEDAVNVNRKLSNGKVYVLQSGLWEVKGADLNEIHEIGHYVETNQRHIVQQSEYLVGCRYDSYRKEWLFIPFSSCIGCSKNESESQFLELEIAASAKVDLLHELNKMNINHYTLYRDEDSLIKKLQFDFSQNCKRMII